MQNSIEIRGNSCTEFGSPVSQYTYIGFFTLSLLKLPNVLMRSFNLVDTKRVFFLF